MIPADFLKKVRAIELASRRLVQAGIAGQYLSAFRGSGMQFREFRQYVYGDDVRHISWNVSARTQDLVLKTFEEERERTLFLIVDVSASLRRGPWAESKAERLAEIAATLALSAAEANDKIGLLLFSDRIEKVVPPKKGKSHLLRIIRDIIAFEPRGLKTDPTLALKQIDQVLKKQSIVVLLSDLEVLPDEKVLRRSASLHEFFVVGVDHPQEWEIPEYGFIELQTAESLRPVTLDTSSPQIRNYLKDFGRTRKNVAVETFKRSAIDLIWLDTQEDFVAPLQDFLRRRAVRKHR